MKTAVEIKRWFKQTFNIPIRCETSRNKGPNPWIGVRIPSEPPANGRHYVRDEPIKYAHTFPPELGKQCMGIVYKGSPSLQEQTWGGNISSTMIAMRQNEWAELFALYTKAQP